jgi:hypothetical protein
MDGRNNAAEAVSRLAGFLAAGADPTEFWHQLLEGGMEATRADAAAAYALQFPEHRDSDLRLLVSRGSYPMPSLLSHRLDFVSFLRECGETIVLSSRRRAFFEDTLMHPAMQSSIVLPLRFEKWEYGALVYNARRVGAFGAPRFQYLDQVARAAGALLAATGRHRVQSSHTESHTQAENAGSSS